MSTPPQRIPPEMSPESIGRRLRLIRLAHGLRPAQISDMLGIERTYWSRFEGGRRAPSVEFACLLTARFGVTLDYLYLGREAGLPLELAERLRAAAAQSDQD
ncbi:helix-turn-helix domain-containing protein [Paracoccus sp. S-4012]|uniref:helix-turn-helix domain-containing protein n=1 Tax=Paracoccus sp. S-4012 TaxID=2665648 RepID=UPI0018A20837|nr:helix-turn-helix transcriptional regulator [Paracoccus sp. S-4012]